MSPLKSLGRLGATVLGFCIVGAAFAADRPDFTGVWGNYRAPGDAGRFQDSGKTNQNPAKILGSRPRNFLSKWSKAEQTQPCAVRGHAPHAQHQKIPSFSPPEESC